MYFRDRVDRMRALENEHADTADRKYAYDFDYRMHAYVLRRLEDHLPRGRALELGCYQGAFTRLLEQRYADLTVAEGAADLIEVARAAVSSRVASCRRGSRLVPDGRFDAIFLIHTLEHLDDAVEQLCGSGLGCAGGCGRLIVVVPNAHAASRQIAVEMGLISHSSAVNGESSPTGTGAPIRSTRWSGIAGRGLHVRDRAASSSNPWRTSKSTWP